MNGGRLLAVLVFVLGLAGPAWAQPAPRDVVRRAIAQNREVARLRAAGRFAEALAIALRIVADLESALGPEDPNVAGALSNLGRLYHKLGDLRRAEAPLKRSVDIYERTLGPEHPVTAIGLNNLALLHHARGEHARAGELLSRAVAAEEKALGPDHPRLATTKSNLALTLQARADYAGAEGLHRRALAIRERALGDAHPEVAKSLNNLAAVLRSTGRYEEARPLFERAISVAEKSLGPSHPLIAAYASNFSLTLRALGDLGTAEALLHRAVAIAESRLGPDHPDLATYLNNLAEHFRFKGHDAGALPLLERALAILQRRLGPDHPHVGGALASLASVYRDYRQARPLYLRAQAILEAALGPEHPRLAVVLNSLARAAMLAGEPAAAVAPAERALAIRERAFGPRHPAVARSLLTLAELHHGLGEYERARPLYERAIAIDLEVLGPDHSDLSAARAALGALELAVGRTREALQIHLALAEAREREIEKVLASGSEREKLDFLVRLLGETHGAVSLHANAAPADPDALRLAAVTVLRRKGRVLDAAADDLAALRRRLGSEERTLLDRLGSLRARIARLSLHGPAQAQRALLARLEGEARQVESQVAARSTAFRAWREPITLAGVQAAIPKGAALVEIFLYRPYLARARFGEERWGAGRYVAYVLRREGDAAWADLGPADAIDAAVLRLRRELATPQSPGAEKRARFLYDKLLRPLAPFLGKARTLLVSPDGALSLVPFSALVDEGGRPLVERLAVVYLASGRDLLRLGSAPPRGGALVVADPRFADPKLPALPGTAGEARLVAEMLPGATVLTAEGASESRLKSVRGPAVLHVATHGFFQPDPRPEPSGWGRALRLTANPLVRSGLVLGAGGGEDGLLTALEASGLDLWGTKLVVLSACETGLGAIENGEGVYGLRRALALAGAERVVMSLWKVGDEATRDLMAGLYRALRDGLGAAEALRRAQLEVMRDPARRHPFFWAGFYAAGDPRPFDWKQVSGGS
jgi:CHAT domain-containing protein